LIDQNPSLLVMLLGSSLGGAIIFAFLLGLERGVLRESFRRGAKALMPRIGSYTRGEMAFHPERGSAGNRLNLVRQSND
jgi:hypothetical protein